ncbi:MAG: hypothetical protein V2A73_08720 [Pseudomonadota bacterium]
MSAIFKHWKSGGFDCTVYDGEAILLHLETDIREHWGCMQAARRRARLNDIFGRQYWADLAGVRKVRLLQALAVRRAGRRNTSGANL